MTELRAADLGLAVRRAAAAMAVLEQELNRADAELGDGDTGGMLARVIAGLAAVPVTDGDLGRTFNDYAQAAALATGSSLGTLMATALLAIGRGVTGRETVPFSELGALLAAARDAMLKRGDTALGDKTVIDAIDAVAAAIAGTAEPQAVAAAAFEAADRALHQFRDQPCRIGRARMWGDKSRGLDDPGMLAFARLTAAVAGRM